MKTIIKETIWKCDACGQDDMTDPACTECGTHLGRYGEHICFENGEEHFCDDSCFGVFMWNCSEVVKTKMTQQKYNDGKY